jgi:hypothetical protein
VTISATFDLDGDATFSFLNSVNAFLVAITVLNAIIVVYAIFVISKLPAGRRLGIGSIVVFTEGILAPVCRFISTPGDNSIFALMTGEQRDFYRTWAFFDEAFSLGSSVLYAVFWLQVLLAPTMGSGRKTFLYGFTLLFSVASIVWIVLAANNYDVWADNDATLTHVYHNMSAYFQLALGAFLLVTSVISAARTASMALDEKKKRIFVRVFILNALQSTILITSGSVIDTGGAAQWSVPDRSQKFESWQIMLFIIAPTCNFFVGLLQLTAVYLLSSSSSSS